MYLFGEDSQTALLPKPFRRIKELIVPRSWFNRWVRSVHGGMQISPIGGELIWGNLTYSVEDDKLNDTESISFGQLLTYIGNDEEKTPIYSNCHLSPSGSINIDMNNDGNIDFHVELNNNNNTYQQGNIGHPFDFDTICCQKTTQNQEKLIESLQKNYTIANWTQILKVLDRRTYDHLMENLELSAPSPDIDITDKKYDNPRYYGNVLWRQLPNAPNLEIYCMYGTGLETGRNYYFTRDHNASFKYSFRINVNYNDIKRNVQNGFGLTYTGDRTVPLLSLGFMCAKGWKNNQRLNPSNITTKIIEYQDGGESLYQRATMRGGKKSGDHIDIMGNHELIKNVLLIATGNGPKYVKQKINSQILKMSEMIPI